MVFENFKNKRSGRERLLFVSALFGMLLGGLAALCIGEFPSTIELAGGYMHAFPAEYTFHSFSAALLYRFAPVLCLYLGGFGALCLLCGAGVLFFKGFLNAGGCLLLFRSCGHGEGFFFLFFLLCLIGLLDLAFYYSCSRLSLLFWEATRKRCSKKALKQYTLDLLFFTGLIFFFYLLQGCITAMIV